MGTCFIKKIAGVGGGGGFSLEIFFGGSHFLVKYFFAMDICVGRNTESKTCDLWNLLTLWRLIFLQGLAVWPEYMGKLAKIY